MKDFLLSKIKERMNFLERKIKELGGSEFQSQSDEWLRALAYELHQSEKVEESLRESENTLSQIINNSSVPTFVIDNNHVVTHWNSACELLTGLDSKDICGSSRHWAAFYKDERPVLADLIVDGVSEKRIKDFYGDKWKKSDLILGGYEGEAFFEFFGKEPKWLYFSAAPLTCKKGQRAGAIEILQDITERKRVERKLRDSQEKLSLFLNANTDIYFLKNAETFVYEVVNSSGAKFFGLSKEQIIGKTDFELMPHEAAKGCYGTDRAAVEKKEKVVSEELIANRVYETTKIPVYQNGRITEIAGIIRDVTEQQQNKSKLEELVVKDTLTKVYNRRAFNDHLKQKLRRADRSGDKVALLLVDLDDFSEINNMLGHEAGDKILKKAAQGLKKSIRSCDNVYRTGGDEFNIILDPINDYSDAGHVAERIIGEFSQVYKIQNRQLHITPSIGITLYPTDARRETTLINNADTAARYAKECGKNRMYWFSKKMNQRENRRKKIKRELERAIEDELFEIEYQPIFSIDGSIRKVEALTRIKCSEKNIIMPFEFIPVAEETGLIKELGSYVLYNACRDIYRLNIENADFHNKVGLSINVSSKEITNSGFSEKTGELLEKVKMDPAQMYFEITEESLIESPEIVNKNIKELREIGVNFTIDDFGKGYSSLSRLIEISADALKIDKEFVSKICVCQKHRSVVEYIIQLADSLNMTSTAEGVDNSEQYELLSFMGCDYYQGFYAERLSPPLPLASLKEYFKKSLGG